MVGEAAEVLIPPTSSPLGSPKSNLEAIPGPDSQIPTSSVEKSADSSQPKDEGKPSLPEADKETKYTGDRQKDAEIVADKLVDSKSKEIRGEYDKLTTQEEVDAWAKQNPEKAALMTLARIRDLKNGNLQEGQSVSLSGKSITVDGKKVVEITGIRDNGELLCTIDMGGKSWTHNVVLSKEKVLRGQWEAEGESVAELFTGASRRIIEAYSRSLKNDPSHLEREDFGKDLLEATRGRVLSIESVERFAQKIFPGDEGKTSRDRIMQAVEGLIVVNDDKMLEVLEIAGIDGQTLDKLRKELTQSSMELAKALKSTSDKEQKKEWSKDLDELTAEAKILSGISMNEIKDRVRQENLSTNENFIAAFESAKTIDIVDVIFAQELGEGKTQAEATRLKKARLDLAKKIGMGGGALAILLLITALKGSSAEQRR